MPFTDTQNFSWSPKILWCLDSPPFTNWSYNSPKSIFSFYLSFYDYSDSYIGYISSSSTTQTYPSSAWESVASVQFESWPSSTIAYFLSSIYSRVGLYFSASIRSISSIYYVLLSSAPFITSIFLSMINNSIIFSFTFWWSSTFFLC